MKTKGCNEGHGMATRGKPRGKKEKLEGSGRKGGGGECGKWKEKKTKKSRKEVGGGEPIDEEFRGELKKRNKRPEGKKDSGLLDWYKRLGGRDYKGRGK